MSNRQVSEDGIGSDICNHCDHMRCLHQDDNPDLGCDHHDNQGAPCGCTKFIPALKDGPAEGIANCKHGIRTPHECRDCFQESAAKLVIPSIDEYQAGQKKMQEFTKAAEPSSPVVRTENMFERECVICGYKWYEHNYGKNCPSCSALASRPTPVVVSAEETPILPPMGDTSNEKWSRYRAIVALSTHPAPLPSDDKWIKCPQCNRENSAETWAKLGNKCPNCGDLFAKDAAALPVGEKESFEEWWHASEQKDIRDDAWASYRNVAERVWFAAKAGEKGEK